TRGEGASLLLVPSLDLEPYRRSDKPEALPNLVRQKSLEAEVQLHILVCEQHKRWRSDRSLRHVIDLHPLRHRNRRLLEIDALQKPIHVAGRDTLPPLASHKL